MKKVYQKTRIFIMLVVVFCTMVIKGDITYASSFNPKVGDYMTLGNVKEPIIWEIVSVKGKVLTLMSASSVGQMVFNTREVKPCGDWSTSKVKEYLNNNFYENYFSIDEKKIILQYNPEDAHKVYIPSLKELGLNDPKVMAKLDKDYKEKTSIFQGEKFEKITLSLHQKGKVLENSFATRNSDNSLNRVINVVQKEANKTSLTYNGGFIKMNIRPVIKITTDFKTENLQFTKGTKKINNESITLYTVENKVQDIYMDNILIDMGSETPMLIKGNTLVSLNVLSDRLKATVDFDAYTQTITLSKDKYIVKVTVNSDQASINGKLNALGTPVLKEGNAFYVPLRFIVEALGSKLTYKDNNIYITMN